MANPYQQRSRRRKFIYFGLIIALFTVSLLHRQFIVEPQAFALQLRPESKGEVEITSSATRLAMFGSRGLAAAVLWQLALEKQKRHQWNELELIVKSITTLQPNFVSPWLFQSWNLAFNVAVECDRTRDKYFYVTRGIQLLAEGERRHQGTALSKHKTRYEFPGNPNMRFYMAVYYIRKIGLSDERNAMRCLFDMSMIDPKERHPDKFASSGSDINLEYFQAFCEKYPRFVRRLRRRLRCREPRDVVNFLKHNQGIPSRFDEADPGDQEKLTKLLPAEQQFPVLPPPVEPRIPIASARSLDRDKESFDIFATSRCWYTFAQRPLAPLPPPDRVLLDEPKFDPMKHRKPRMSTFLFRSFPARAQEYIAENLEEEGWFDEDGWEIHPDASIDGWFKDPVVVGTASKYHSRRAWRQAFDDYEDYGKKLGILLPKGELEELQKKALAYERKQLYWKMKKTDAAKEENLKLKKMKLEELAKLEEDEKGSYEAHTKLDNRRMMVVTGNFYGHYDQCKVEREDYVVNARKMLFDADERFFRAEPVAEARYREAFAHWLPILLHHPKFSKLDNVMMIICNKEHRYLSLREDDFKISFKRYGDPPMIYMGVGMFGNLHHLMSPPVAGVPAIRFVVDDTELKAELRAFRDRVIPLRNKTGFLDWLYFYQTPKREELRRNLLRLTRGTHAVPFAVSPLEHDLMLTAVSHKFRRDIPQSKWEPLVPINMIEQAREDVLIERYYKRRK